MIVKVTPPIKPRKKPSLWQRADWGMLSAIAALIVLMGLGYFAFIAMPDEVSHEPLVPPRESYVPFEHGNMLEPASPKSDVGGP